MCGYPACEVWVSRNLDGELPRKSVSASYNHALHLNARAKMMQEWGDFLDQTQKGAKVLHFRNGVT
jgi:hypothetical protein